MTYCGLYLGVQAALLAQVGHSPDADADERFTLRVLCGCLLLAGAGLLVLGTMGGEW